jgi:predicted nuclease with RNAse H fold
VDLAAADARTALAAVQWSDSEAVVEALQLGVSDDELIQAIRGADKAGLDCPLGWPAPFVSFVVAQQSGQLPATVHADGAAWRRQLAYRLTDEVVRAEAGLVPLSVSADRIAHTAFRCAALLARLSADGRPVDRCGDGVVVEVYPAATLRRWGLTHRGYKTPGRTVGHGFLVDELTAAAPWLHLGAYEQLCRTSHDAFDAVVAAITARAAAIGHVLMPDAAQRDIARTEGWIALPTGRLDQLIPMPVNAARPEPPQELGSGNAPSPLGFCGVQADER